MGEKVEVEVQTYEVGKYEITDETATILEAWFGAVKSQYESFDEFIRSAGRKEIEPFVDQPVFSKYVLEYLKKEGGTREIKFSSDLYASLEARAKEKNITIERLVEKLIEEGIRVPLEDQPMSDIPLEYWPRCHWCGEYLGEVSLEVETEGNHKRCICPECRDIVNAAIAEYAPYFLGELLKHYADSNESLEAFPHHRDLGPDDIEKMAREAMLKNV